MVDTSLFSPGPVAVVGNVCRDLKLRDVPPSAALFTDGETSVAPIEETIGGGGANSACAAAALGAQVRFLGKVGDDALGRRLGETLARHGVEPHLTKDALHATGNTVAVGWNTGHRHFLSCQPNNEALRFEDLDVAALAGCEHLLRADVWFSQSMLEDGNRRLFAAARRQGLTTSLDINFDPAWSTNATEAIARRKRLLRETLGEVDVAHGNTRELCQFTDAPDLPTALRRLSVWGVREVVAHLGAEGAGLWANDQWYVEPPDLAERVVNSTGTGDVLSLCMILLHRRTELPPRQKLRLANQVVREFVEGHRVLIPTL